MIEIEERAVLPHLAQDAGEPAAARRGKFDEISHAVLLAKLRILGQRRFRHPLEEFRIARAKGIFRLQFEDFMCAVLQADQMLFDRRSELPGAQLQGRRAIGECTDDILTIDRGQSVMQGEISA